MKVLEAIKILNDLGIDVTTKDRNCLNIEITELSSPESSKEGSLSYSYNSSDTSTMQGGIIFLNEMITENPSIIPLVCKEPKTAFIIVACEFMRTQTEPKVKLINGNYIQEGAKIDPTAKIGPGCYIYSNVKIGARTVIEPNSVIGATGTNFKWHNGVKYVMPQVGGVSIGTDCFIGSNVTIVRGAFDDTILEDGVIIAHGSQIGHDVKLGKHTFLANGVNVAGYAQTGEKCWIGSGVSIRNRMILGKEVKVGSGAVVVKNWGDNLTLVGVPAKPLNNNTKSAYDLNEVEKLRRKNNG